ncbi:hypothetical protein DV738_g2481, partial [Chaetothyriales sp. CBS 135597]
MIINPSHKITLSGLPPEILDAYVRYKKGTRAIVSWIIQFGPPERAGARSLPLKEMARLASAAVEKLKELPDVIHFHFRETIAARKRLSKYFRGSIDSSPEEVDTVNHEHFTTSLTEIYEILCTKCAKTKRRQERIRLAKESRTSEEKIANRFGHIALVEDGDENEDADTDDGVSQSDSCEECKFIKPRSCPGPQKDIVFADDDLARRIQVNIVMQAISDHVEAVKELWQQAACGSLHIITASIMTNVACAAISRLEASLRDEDETIRLPDIAAMCCTVPGGHLDTDRDKPQDLHSFIKRLQNTDMALGHYTDGHQSIKIVSCSTCMQRPADFVQSAPTLGQDDNLKLARALIDNLMHLLAAGDSSPGIVRNSSTVYQDIKGYMVRSDESAGSLKLAFGLELLSQSYKAYLLNLDSQSSPAACRLSALRLAQQAMLSVKDVRVDKTSFPCQCPQTLAFHLYNLEMELMEYVRHRCWDLYFQSPWIAGNHMLEMIDLGHYYGEKLFAYRHYVGSVLHSYNILGQLAGLQKIPVLEFLCRQFESTFFPGGRPTSNFRACWTRYIGARLKFNKGHRTRSQRDSWCMAIPAHAAKKAAGLGVGQKQDFGFKDDCLLFKIKQQEYKVSDAQWEAVSTDPNPCARFSALAAVIDKELRDEQKTKSGMMAAPAAAINPFAVFSSCVGVIKTLSDQTHNDPKEKGMNCICFVTAIIQGAERIVNARKLGRTTGAAWTKDEREGVIEMTSKTMSAEFTHEQGQRNKWMWDI